MVSKGEVKVLNTELVWIEDAFFKMPDREKSVGTNQYFVHFIFLNN